MADDSNKKKKEKKHWFKDFRTELKKVTWLTPKQLAKNTATVIVMVLIVAVIVFVLDFAFEALNKHGVEKLKSYVQSSETNQVEESTNNTNSVEDAINNIIDESVNTENQENNVIEE